MLIALLLSVTTTVTGHAIDERIYATVWGSTANGIPQDGPLTVGTTLTVPFQKFLDDPADPIVTIEWRGRAAPLATYGAEMLLDHGCGADDYQVSERTWWRMRIVGTAYPSALRRTYEARSLTPWQPSFHYGNLEPSLQAFDGTVDFAGSSGFRRDYGDDFDFPLAVGPLGGEVEGYYHLTLFPELVHELVRQPGDSLAHSWAIIQIDAPQWWQFDYGPVVGSAHAMAHEVNPGWIDLDGEFVAVTQSGRVIDSSAP